MFYFLSKRAVYSVLLCAAFLLLSGCIATTSQPIRAIKGNTFYSTDQPKLKILVEREFKYIGAERDNEFPDSLDGNVRVKRETHYFVSYDENSKIEKGITIIIAKISNGRWRNDFTKDFVNKTIFGTIELGNNYYQYIVSGTTLNGSYYADNGYIPSEDVALVTFIRNLGGNGEVVFSISYFESIESLIKRLKEEQERTEPSFMESIGLDPNSGWNTPQAEADAFNNANQEERFALNLLKCAKMAIKISDIEDDEIQALTVGD